MKGAYVFLDRALDVVSGDCQLCHGFSSSCLSVTLSMVFQSGSWVWARRDETKASRRSSHRRPKSRARQADRGRSASAVYRVAVDPAQHFRQAGAAGVAELGGRTDRATTSPCRATATPARRSIASSAGSPSQQFDGLGEQLSRDRVDGIAGAYRATLRSNVNPLIGGCGRSCPARVASRGCSSRMRLNQNNWSATSSTLAGLLGADQKRLPRNVLESDDQILGFGRPALVRQHCGGRQARVWPTLSESSRSISRTLGELSSARVAVRYRVTTYSWVSSRGDGCQSSASVMSAVVVKAFG